MSKLCIICYRQYMPGNYPDGVLNQLQELLKTFFRWFARYLGGDMAGCDDADVAQLHLTNLINSGMISCEDCSKTVDSFCALYHQMKSLELSVNWKVGTLSDIMFNAENVPARISDFQNCAKQADIGFGWGSGEIIKSVLRFNKNLRRKFLMFNNSTKTAIKNEANFKVTKPCIICDRPSQPNSRGLRKHQQSLKRFLRLLGRHLDVVKSSYNRDCSDVAHVPLENIIHAGMISCEDCSKIGESFCDLCHQMKTSELRINWKMEILKDILLSAERIPDGVSSFKSCVAQLHIGLRQGDAGGIINSVLELKRNLRRKCDLKLRNMCPRLMLHKYQEELHDISSDLGRDTTQIIMGGDDSDECLEVSESTDNESKPSIAMEFEIIKKTEVATEPIMRINPKTGKHWCRCSKEFRSLEKYRAHYKSTHLVRYKCKLCQKIYSSRKEFNRHHRKFHTASQLNCPSCWMRFKDEASLSQHNSLECKILCARYACQHCGRRFRSAESLKCHVMVHNLQRQTHKCEFCQKEYNWKDKLQIHLRETHSISAYKCLLCQEAFNRRNQLRSHCKTNHPELQKRHICETCGKSFGHSKNLKEHVKGVHLRSPEHVCDTCGKIFFTRCRLNNHVNSVHLKKKWRKYVCKRCGRGFLTNSALKVHVNAVHLKLWVHACDLCDKKFSRSAHVKRHRLQVHGNSSGGEIQCP